MPVQERSAGRQQTVTPFWRASEGVEISSVDDGFIAYDEGADRVHYLNHTATVVLLLCNGRNTAEEIARLMQEHFHLQEPPYEHVNVMLAQLAEEHLIEPIKLAVGAPEA